VRRRGRTITLALVGHVDESDGAGLFRCLPISWPYAVATRASRLWGGCIKRRCTLGIAQEREESCNAFCLRRCNASGRSTRCRCGLTLGGRNRKQVSTRRACQKQKPRTRQLPTTLPYPTLPAISNSPSRLLGMSFRRLHRTEPSQSALTDSSPKCSTRLI
jgi:hypothetical protein